MEEKNPKEFWVIPDDKYSEDSICVTSLKQITKTFHHQVIHVIEYSAYKDAMAERDELIEQNPKLIHDNYILQEQNKILREALESLNKDFYKIVDKGVSIKTWELMQLALAIISSKNDPNK